MVKRIIQISEESPVAFWSDVLGLCSIAVLVIGGLGLTGSF
jgi:hypothetical protein